MIKWLLFIGAALCLYTHRLELALLFVLGIIFLLLIGFDVRVS